MYKHSRRATSFCFSACYQRGSPCQDQAGNWTTQRPPDHHKETKRHKLQWHGHASHSSDLAKTILQGTVKGGRRQGRQRKRWEDNIREWTGLEFTKTKRAVKKREKWRKQVVKSSVVLKQPLWLKNRWWGREGYYLQVLFKNLFTVMKYTVQLTQLMFPLFFLSICKKLNLEPIMMSSTIHTVSMVSHCSFADCSARIA